MRLSARPKRRAPVAQLSWIGEYLARTTAQAHIGRARHGRQGQVANRVAGKGSRAHDAYWRAANYLSVGQIYLFDNPLLREPLKEEHIKPRLLGHWGTTPGLNFIYAHLNRPIKKHDLDMIYVIGPGHGGPGIVANAYLENLFKRSFRHAYRSGETHVARWRA